MNLLFISSEFSRVSGDESHGRVIAGLSGALSALGHKVTAVLPLRDAAVVDKWSLARRLSPVVVELPSCTKQVAVFDGRLPSGVEVKLLANDDLFVGHPWCAEVPSDDPMRYAVFARAALAVAESEPVEWHVVHGVGLAGALASYLASTGGASSSEKWALSVESVEHQGRYDKSWVDRLGLDWQGFTPEGFEFYGDLSLLKAGLLTADRVILPGPAALLEARSAAGGFGLEGVLRARGDGAVGLLPGLDYSRWNPATDVHLSSRYDAELLIGKQSCKADLQNRLGLPVRRDIPLVAIIPPLEDLADSLSRGLDRLLRSELQLVAPRGLAEPLEKQIDEALGRWPDRITRLELDERSEHQLLAGADFVLVDAPTDAEARPLLAALRYGALPVVRNVGVARDLVTDLTSTLESGNGFTLTGGGTREMISTVRRALGAYGRLDRRDGRLISKVVSRAMTQPCSYEDVARRLEQIYGELLPARGEA